MADRNLELALRIRAAVEGAETVEDLRQRLGGLSDELEQAANPTDEFNRGLRETEDAGRRAGAGVDEASGKFGELTSVIKGFLGLALAKEILDLNDRLTTLQRGFEVVTGSSEATARALSFVRETADRLGVSALDLSDSYLKITAAAKGTQLEGAATEKIFSSIAGAMATVGGAGEDLERVMDAVGQMMGKGVISAEELRGQLGDSLPGAVQQAAQALMVSNAELSKMLESGEIVASEFLPKFAAQLEQSMGGGGQRVETFAAAWNRLMNQFADFGTGDVGAAATKMLVFITDALGGLARGAGFASDLVGALGRTLGGIAAGNFGEAFSDLGQDVSDATLHMMGLKTESEAAAERQRQIAEELRNLTPEMDRFQDAVGRGDLKALPESLQGAITELRKTADVAAATEQAITNFMSAPAKNLDLTGVLKLATSLQAVGKEAADAGEEISATLGAQLAKLTNEQLVELEKQARKAMAAAGDDQNARKVFADLGQVIEGVLLARLERLGVDGPEALKGISLAAQDAMDDFEALAQSGQLSGDAIEKAFDGALAKLDSPEELKQFKQQIIDLGNDGKLTGEQVERALLLIRQRAQEVAADPALELQAKRMADVAKAAGDQTSAIEAVAQATISGIRADIDKANALGQTSIAQQKTIELSKAEAEWAKVVAAAKQAELQAQIASNQAKMAALAAAGLQTEESKKQYAALALTNAALTLEGDAIKKGVEAKEAATQSAAVNTKATQANTAATAENTEATEQAEESAGGLARALGSLIDYWRQKTAALSEATKALFEFSAGLSKINPQAGRESIGGISDEAEKASQKIGELTAFVRQMDQQMLFSTNSVGRYMDMIQKSGAAAEKAYYEQKLEAENLEAQLQKMTETGGTGLDGLVQQANRATDSLWLLGQQDLDQLQAAIDGANDKLREMQEEAQSAKDKLAELDAQIAEARGDKDRADRLKLELEQQRALAEVEKKLTEARALGERELIALYEEQKRKLQELYTLKERNLGRDQRNPSNSDRSNPTSGSTTTTTAPPRGGISGGITVNLNAPNARYLDPRASEELARAIRPALLDIERRLR